MPAPAGIISSRDNPHYKRLKKLAESARARRQSRTTLLDGPHLIEACLQAGGKLLTVVRSAAAGPGAAEAFAATSPDARLLILSEALFTAVSPVATPSGVLAEAAWLSPATPEGVPLVVLLEDIQDPGNLGSLLRSAAAAGASAAVLNPGCADPWSPKTLRGGQGAQFFLPLAETGDLGSWLAGKPLQSVALSLHAKTSLYELDLTRPTALLLGNEGAGLSPGLLATVQVHVRIPMPGRVESLNVGAAAAAALFEAVRQRMGMRR